MMSDLKYKIIIIIKGCLTKGFLLEKGGEIRKILR